MSFSSCHVGLSKPFALSLKTAALFSRLFGDRDPLPTLFIPLVGGIHSNLCIFLGYFPLQVKKVAWEECYSELKGD